MLVAIPMPSCLFTLEAMTREEVKDRPRKVVMWGKLVFGASA